MLDGAKVACRGPFTGEAHHTPHATLAIGHNLFEMPLALPFVDCVGKAEVLVFTAVTCKAVQRRSNSIRQASQYYKPWRIVYY